jgi:chromosome segregation ATPase
MKLMLYPFITFLNTAEDKKNNEIAKLRSEYEVIMDMKDAKYAKLQKRLASTKEEVVSEKAKWQDKLDTANAEVDQASDELYLEKRKRRDAVQVQINKANKKQKELQNYIDSLADDNVDLEQEWLIALEGQKKASELRGKAEHIAAKRLEKWHKERNARRDAQDQLVIRSRALPAPHLATRVHALPQIQMAVRAKAPCL